MTLANLRRLASGSLAAALKGFFEGFNESEARPWGYLAISIDSEEYLGFLCCWRDFRKVDQVLLFGGLHLPGFWP